MKIHYNHSAGSDFSANGKSLKPWHMFNTQNKWTEMRNPALNEWIETAKNTLH